MKLRRDDAIAAGITAALMATYFVLPVAAWFVLVMVTGIAIAAKTGLN